MSDSTLTRGFHEYQPVATTDRTLNNTYNSFMLFVN